MPSKHTVKGIAEMNIVKMFIILMLISVSYSNEDIDFDVKKRVSETIFSNQFTQVNENHFIKSEDYVGYRYMQLYQNVHIFLEDGVKINLTVSDAEVTARVESYKKVLSERFLNKSQIYNIIIIEKYLKKVKGIFPADETISNLYVILTDSIVNQTKPTFAEMEPLLNSMALFSDPQIGELIQEKNDEIVKEEYENVISKKLFWTVNELRATGKPDDCIAFDANKNQCMITVSMFNSSIPLKNISKKTPLDSARDEILREILSDIYLSNLAIESGYNEKLSIKELIAQSKAQFKYSQKFISLGRIVKDENTLFATYKKYYKHLFSPKDEVFLNVLGSSDSVYIDSVYTWLCAAIGKSSERKRNSDKINQTLKKLPWQRSNWNELPDELVLPTNAIDVNEFTKPVKTPYGYFIVHIDEIKRYKEISFEDAYAELVYLATRDKWQNVDSILDEKAYEIYTKDKNRYVTPDTMNLTLYLFPYYSDSTHKNRMPDTLSLKGVRLCSIYLPFEVQEKLKAAYYQTKNRNVQVGPIYTRYGAFYFRVHTYKKGGIQHSFDDVRDYLISEIKADERKDSGANAKYQDDIIDRMFLGQMYFIEDVTYARTMSYDQIMALIESSKIDISAVKNKSSKNDCYQYGKAQYERMKINEYNENVDNWIKNLQIDLSHFN